MDAAQSLIRFTEFTFPRYRTALIHTQIAEQLERVERGEIDRLMLLVPPRHGKALEISTPIATPDGWRTIGELKIGDHVFDDAGAPCTVVAVSPTWRNRPVFRVLTDDGDEIIADADHEWLVRLCRKHQRFALKTTEYLAKRKGRAPMIRAALPINLPSAALSIDPYVLGVWLGDGRTNSAAICSADNEIIDTVSVIEGGYTEYASKGVTRHIRPGPHYREGAAQAETLQGRLRKLGLLGNKRIPILYLRGSIEQRKSLLQGLVDTDGYVAADGQIEICTILPNLADDIKELVHSLGHKASINVGRATLNGRDCGPKYRVMFYMAGAARLDRKAKKCRHGKRAFRRYITVEPAGFADTVCIEVDSPTHLFLAGKSLLPTHNSELASRRFPAYYLGRHPERQFISASAAGNLAEDFGRDVRNIIASPDYRVLFDARLSEDSQAKGRWNTAQGGSYYAVGVKSAVMGRGAHVFMIDDPFGTMADARSEIERKAVWDWYTGTVYNRLENDGAIVLINHRMHEDDLTGMLLAQQAAGGDRWEVVELKPDLQAGLALWPEKYPVEALDRIRRNTTPQDWSALYLQNPIPDEGSYFKAEWLKPYDKAPARNTLTVYGASDYAVTADGGDYTVHVIIGVDPENNLYLLDVWRKQASADEWVESFCDLVIEWKPMGWAEEQGQIKAGVGPFLTRRQGERRAYVAREAFPTRGDKAVRAQSIRGRMALNGLYVPTQAPWVAAFRAELLGFPSGKHDDQVDALGLIGQLLDHMTAGRVPKQEPPSHRDSYRPQSGDDRNAGSIATI